MMHPWRKPLVLIPQYFGSLVFERHTSRYLPFDHESTQLLLSLLDHPVDSVLAPLDPDERDAVIAFVDCFYERGFFGLDGRLAADLLAVDPPFDHLVGPLAVHLEIIGACNLTCTHCFAGALPRNHDPLRVEEMDRLFSDLAALGSFRLGLTGGEPLLRKDLFDVLDAAVGRGLHPCLTTNALLLTEQSAHELGRRDLVWLNVSLEGPTRESNDRVRGSGTFDAVIDRLRLLRRHARFTLAFTITSDNAHLVRQCAELACDVGAHTAVFRPLYPAGVALEHLELMPTFAQYQGALSELSSLEARGEDLRGLDPFSPASRETNRAEVHTSHTCGAGQHVCSISVQGEVSPCSFLGTAFHTGSIRRTPFPEIWRTGWAMRRMRQPSAFQGGCRARSLVLAGSAEAPDPWMNEFLGSASVDSPERPWHPGANVETTGRRVPLPLA
jgi:MoaA/NifB/PqqE/SkfB family radical SAM enzyme